MQVDRARGTRRATWWIGAHALAVALSWVPLLVIGVLLADDSYLVDALPRWLLGAALLTVAMFAFPLLWPAFIALGLFEGRLAERTSVGDLTAVRTASRIIAGLGIALVGLAALAAAVGMATATMWWSEHQQETVLWAWTGPAALGCVHLVLARHLHGQSHRVEQREVGDLSRR